MWHCNCRCEGLLGCGTVTDVVRSDWEWRVTDGVMATVSGTVTDVEKASWQLVCNR